VKEGTKSILFGCHNPLFHGTWVLLAWKLEYKAWPRWWELLGIYLHDIGVWNRQYLSNNTAKIGHWELGAVWGAEIVLFLHRLWPKFGLKSGAGEVFTFMAGHCPEESQYKPSKLMRADKRSHLLEPKWWQYWTYWLEFKKFPNGPDPRQWRQAVRENLKRQRPIGNHELYIWMRDGHEPKYKG
jgi:hypothetical protein